MYSGKTSTILVSRVKRPSSIAKPAAIAVTVLLIEYAKCGVSLLNGARYN
jgi:hypothetical protein